MAGITAINDLEPAARRPAEALTRLLTGFQPTGEEPLMAIFEWALEGLSTQPDTGEPKGADDPPPR